MEQRTTPQRVSFAFLIGASILLFALVVAASGCDSSESTVHRLSKADYQAKLLAIEYEYNAPASRLFTKLVLFDPASGTPDLASPACADSAREFAGTLHDIVNSVAALTPPKDVEALQNSFLKEAQTSVAAVDEAARDAKAGRLSCGREMNIRIYGLASTERAEAVIASLEERGYTILGD